LSKRAYISTIAPGWPVEQQEALLAECVPGWPDGVVIFRDEPDARQRQGHSLDVLSDRAGLLRKNSPRKAGETILCATLAVLAWGKADFLTVLDAARSRRAIILPVDTGEAIGLDTPAEDAVAAYMASRLAGSQAKSRQVGAAVSAAVRRKRADEGAERIRDRWPLPSSEWSTAELRRIAGEPGAPIAYNTLVDRLGPREEAQRKHQIKLKRAASRSAKE